MAVNPTPIASQTIYGTLLDNRTHQPIAGGFVTLIDSAGQAVRADFSGADGSFALGAPGPGSFQLRIDRIGFASRITEFYELVAEQRLSVAVRIPLRPVRLNDLRVVVSRSCVDDPTDTGVLATAWAEFRKAIRTTVWAEGRGELTFTLREYARTLSSANLRELASTERTRRGIRLPPFKSLSGEQLAIQGYGVSDADSLVLYAPDASVLLSTEFSEGYCFGLRRTQVDDLPRLGITFRPRRDRDVIDVEGIIWLDELSAELRRVDIKYRNLPLPRGTRRALVGSELVFDRIPNGPFFIKEWWVRLPIGHLERSNFSLRLEPVIDVYRQIGGRVTEVLVNGVPILRETPPSG